MIITQMNNQMIMYYIVNLMNGQNMIKIMIHKKIQ